MQTLYEMCDTTKKPVVANVATVKSDINIGSNVVRFRKYEPQST